MSRLYYRLEDAECANVSLVGGKARGLHLLLSNGFSVPAGVVLSAPAFSDHIMSAARFIRKFKERLEWAENEPDGPGVSDFLSEMRSMILKRSCARHIQRTLESIVRDMSGQGLLAVRSSATVEDLDIHSWAGQFDTFLHVPVTVDGLSTNLKRVWASVFTPRVLSYAKAMDMPLHKIQMAVILQTMLSDSQYSGVLFTRHPTKPKSKAMYTEVVPGVSQELVGGRVDPSCYEFEEDIRFVRSGAAGIEIPREVLREVFSTGLRIQEALGKAVDIEWTARDNSIMILQVRPISRTAFSLRSPTESVKGRVILTGLPASAGVGSGYSKIVFNVDQVMQISHGQVLVTPMTSPDMVPYMGQAAAIITDVGGLICHTAIVAREMGIPCVVGTTYGTSRIKEGQEVTVDGDSGVVYEGHVATDRATSPVAALEIMANRLMGAINRSEDDIGLSMVVSSFAMAADPLLSSIDADILFLPAGIEQLYLIELAKRKNELQSRQKALSLFRAWYEKVSGMPTRKLYILLPQLEKLHVAILDLLGRADLSATTVASQRAHPDSSEQHAVPAVFLRFAEIRKWLEPQPPKMVFLHKRAGDEFRPRDISRYLRNCGATAIFLAGYWKSSEVRLVADSCSSEVIRTGPTLEMDHLPDLESFETPQTFFGHIPEKVKMSYPYPPRTGPWWPENWHYEWSRPDSQETIWVNIRPEIVNTPLTKSLIVQGVESIPYVLGFSNVGPLHTRWRNCRVHVEPGRLNELRVLHAKRLAGHFEELCSYIRALHNSYQEWTTATDEIHKKLGIGRRKDISALVADFKRLWGLHERFFALCFLIQTIGDDLIWPKIHECVRSACESLGVRDPGPCAHALMRVLASPPEQTLSSAYMDSLYHLSALYRKKTAKVPGAVQQHGSTGNGSDQGAHWEAAVKEHLERWGWMRDRDLVFPPLDSREAVEELVSTLLTDQKPKQDPGEWYRVAEMIADVYAPFGLEQRFLHLLLLGVTLHIERENHHLIWVRNVHVIRKLLLGIGDHLVERGALDDRAEIFYLQIPEVLEMVSGDGKSFVISSEKLKNRKLAFMIESKQVGPGEVDQMVIKESDYY